MSDTPATTDPFILFQLAGTTYGLPSGAVRQMEMIDQITPVPRALPFVEGVISLRGQIIPVVDLRARFGLPRAPYDTRTRLIVVAAASRTVGLIVDSAREFLAIPRSAVRPPPEAIGGLSGAYLSGIATLGQRVVLILDVEAVLTRPDSVLAGLPAQERE